MHRTQQTQNRPFGFSFQNGSSFFPHSLHALKDPYSPSPSTTAPRFPPLPPHSINHTSQIRYSLSQCIARRTRVVPNRSFERRPSGSMAGRRPSHFFKIILPSTIDDKKLVMLSPYLACFLLALL